MPTQGNLFGGVGTPIGSSIFDPAATSTQSAFRQMGAAERSALTFTRSQPLGFNQPGGVGPQRQTAFNFAGSSRRASRASIGARLGKGFGGGLRRALGPFGILTEVAFGGAIVAAGAIQGSAQWGASTGLEEDYVGGAVYGATKGVGTAVGGAIGGIGGFAAGAAIGSVIPGAGTVVGGIIGLGIGLAGALGGAIGGEQIGGSLIQGPARQAGLAARAISRTARAVDRIQFGGNFVDSAGAHTMRQRAVADMSGSMMNARQFLGNEAVFLHER